MTKINLKRMIMQQQKRKKNKITLTIRKKILFSEKRKNDSHIFI